MSDGTRFYGQVTGMELDTKALDGDGTSTVAALYLDQLPGRASYGLSFTEDEDIKKSVMDRVSKDGQPSKVKLMLDVTGNNQETRSSIGYTIIRMKADGPEPDGNVTAYRYYNGTVSRLPCRTITSDNGPIYETIYAGPGTFAFVGPFREPPPEWVSLRNVLIFSGVLGLVLLFLVSLTIIIIKRSGKRSDKT